MTFAKARLIAAVMLFGAWLAYLGYSALTIGHMPVVSHSQVLVSTLDVIADVQAGEDGRPLPKVVVQDVHWPADRKNLAGREIEVNNLTDANLQGFMGAGRYILPLTDGVNGSYRIADLPRSPGFESSHPTYFIYPDTAVTRQELDAISKSVPKSE